MSEKHFKMQHPPHSQIETYFIGITSSGMLGIAIKISCKYVGVYFKQTSFSFNTFQSNLVPTIMHFMGFAILNRILINSSSRMGLMSFFCQEYSSVWFSLCKVF